MSHFGIDLAVSTPCNPYQPSNILAYTIWGVLGRKGVQRPKQPNLHQFSKCVLENGR